MAKKALKEVEEKIVAWALLSGLTSRDLVRIGGRLQREERISKHSQEISKITAEFSWTRTQSGNWLLSNAVHGDKGEVFNIVVRSIDDTKFDLSLVDQNSKKISSIKHSVSSWFEYNLPKKIYPDRNRGLYSVMLMILGQKYTQFKNWPKSSSLSAKEIQKARKLGF